MDFELSEVQTLIRQTARQFAESRLLPGAAARDREEAFPTSELRELAQLGLMGVNVPTDVGGADAGAVSYSLAMMEIARACASTSVTMGVTNMCAELIARQGTPAQRERFVPKLTSGDALCGAFALSEPHAGSDPGAISTRAVKDGASYVLSGSKQWISHGREAGVTVVWARTSDAGTKGLSCFILEGHPPGLHVGKPEQKMGLRASHTVPLAFENMRVPEAQRLGAEGQGFRFAMMALDGGRIGIASQACGVARAALEASVRYAKERQAFGRPIADFQAIRWFLANAQTELTAAELLTLRAAQLKEAGQPFTREASMAKLFASEVAQRACDKALQIHGGYGYLNDYPVERYFRDARVQTIYEGTSEVQRLVIAREVLKG
ncbi:MAG: acyl-CoA dehydrogenase family protein [Myxococcaceae bacterium]